MVQKFQESKFIKNSMPFIAAGAKVAADYAYQAGAQYVKQALKSQFKGNGSTTQTEYTFQGKKKRQQVPTLTTGHYRGPFNKPKQVKKSSKVMNFDAQLKIESGGVQSVPIDSSSYVGHGIAPNRLLETVMQALMRKLFQKAGITISNFEDNIVRDLMVPVDGTVPIYDYPNYIIRYGYHIVVNADPSSTPLANSVTWGEHVEPTFGGTWGDLAHHVLETIQGDISLSALEAGQLYFVQFVLLANHGEEWDTLASMPVEQTTFDLEFYSNLKIQNRTKSSTGDLSTEVVNANPLEGKIYRTNKWRNGFDLKRTTLAAQSGAHGLYTKNNEGIILADSSVTQSSILQKPPSPYIMGVNKCNSVTLQPSDIKYSKIAWKTKIGFNEFVHRMWKYFIFTSAQVGSDPIRCELGFSELVGLECMLHDRVETITLDVGYELNQTYTVKCNVSKPRLVPSVTVL